MHLLLYFTSYFSLCCILPLSIPIAYFNKTHNSATTKADAVKLDWLMLLVHFRLALGISLDLQFGVNEYWYKNYSCNTKVVPLYYNSVFITWLAGFEMPVNPSNCEDKSKNIFISESGKMQWFWKI